MESEDPDIISFETITKEEMLKRLKERLDKAEPNVIASMYEESSDAIGSFYVVEPNGDMFDIAEYSWGDKDNSVDPGLN